MLLRKETASWDFTPVINLVYALTNGHGDRVTSPTPQHEDIETASVPAVKAADERVTQLGNFDEIWKYLNQPLDRPPPVLTPDSNDTDVEVSGNDVATTNTNVKSVRWQDEAEGAHLDDGNANTIAGANETLSKLTKQQRKKERRRQRKEVEAATGSNPTGLAFQRSSDSDSNTESVLQRSNERRAIIQQILSGQSTTLSKSTQKVIRRFLNDDTVKDRPTRDLSQTKQSSVSVVAPVRAPPTLPDDSLAIAAARKRRLVSKLCAIFINERQLLRSASLLQHHTTGTETSMHAIHVFVDISNVGFQIRLMPNAHGL